MPMRQWITLTLSLLGAAILLAAALNPSLRDQVRSYLSPKGRTILASAQGPLLGSTEAVEVIKFRENQSLYVEVLRGGQLVERLTLPDTHDGYFNFHGQVTRLAIGDIDGDGRYELLAPTFDNQLVPHLNVFRYNPALSRFEPVEASPRE